MMLGWLASATKKSKKVNRCRCCGNENLIRYLNLGKQPLANSYHKKQGKLDRFPLEVMLCTTCYHSQLSVVVSPDIMFKNYLYVSGTTTTLKKHFDKFAVDALKRFDKEDITVLDIACNDGTLLESFRSRGARVVGVDPAENLRKITEEKGLDVVVDYWDSDSADEALDLVRPNHFDIITAANVFAHVDDLREFLRACSKALSDDGLVFLEFPYAVEMIQNNEFDTIYHEHLNYFLAHSFYELASRMDFSIIDIIPSKIHGGSIRFVLKKGWHKNSFKLLRLIKREREMGLLTPTTYIQFAQRIEQNKESVRKVVDGFRKMGRKVVGYGASAKGNTMLNYFDIKLEYIVDDNPLKWGHFTPGKDIYITTPKVLEGESRTTCILILSWNFKDEIIKKVNTIRYGKRIYYIVYVPSVKVWPEGDK